MTHCDVITLLSDCIPLEVSLQLRFCKFSSSIHKYGTNIVRTVSKLELRNSLSVYCEIFLEMTYQCVYVHINECHSMWKTGIILSLMKSEVNLMFWNIVIDMEWKCTSWDMNVVDNIINEICLNWIECFFKYLFMTWWWWFCICL